MNELLEFIAELVFEGSMEISKSKNVPKYIRYPLIVIIGLFFVLIIGIIFLVGIISLKENAALGIFFILLGLFILVMSVVKFRKVVLAKRRKENQG